MKRNILLLLLALTITVFANATSVSDSIFNSEIKILKKQFNDVLQKNDSLEIELEKINSKQLILEYNENYFQTALGSQTNIFSFITGGLFLLFGLITFVGINKRIESIENKTTRQLEEQNTKFDEFKLEVKSMESKISRQAYEGYIVIATRLMYNQRIVQQHFIC